ncbi:circumsporozoite protein-membrane associated protein, partial [Stieleria sp. TO1_6]|nr:circumsporozoite protein-membrane associated protein [Stieleria tagensis]
NESGGNETGESSEGSSDAGDPMGSPRDASSPQSSHSAAKPNASPQSSAAGDGEGGEMGQSQSDAAAETPPPPDLEYAKKATDMVLDYLDETRDQVDQDLLDDLNWTAADLQRFRERWQKVRQIDPGTPDAAAANEMEDALRSLGLQANPTPRQSTRRDADSLRNLRDSGNRRQAPPAIRDAFDAFRRRQ